MDRVHVSVGSVCATHPASAVCTVPTVSVMTSPAPTSEENSVEVSIHGDAGVIEIHRSLKGLRTTTHTSSKL